ncbi:MAG: hypothetical protein H7Y06_00370 [Opitutaceae bacterium]|nr:hypothetical protein [Opitutaceae bacterium]
MKSPCLLAFAICLSAAFAASSQAKEEILHSFNFAKATVAPTYVAVNDSEGGANLLFLSGCKLSPDAEAPGGNALVFDGAATEPGISQRVIPGLETVQFKLRFKPSETGAPLQTLVALNATYELRYNRDKSALEFIILYPEKKYTYLRADVPAGIWSQAQATYKDRKLTLIVGLARKEIMLPEGAVLAPVPTTLRVARTATERPFTGSISELSISTP